MALNPELVKLARYTVGKQRTKQAFQPPQDPSQQGGAPGGAPPMDPSMAGGAGAPPMDPSMAGGGAPPPMDPSMAGGDPSAGGGAVPGAGGLTADSIRQMIQDAMSQMGMAPGAGGAGGVGGKGNKNDQMQAMSMDIFQIKKMMSTLFNAMGIPLPQDILDGPNRDPASGAPMPPGMPGSTSDPSRQSPPAGGAAGGGGGGAQPQSAIKPIGPLQGAFPQGGGDAGGGGGGEKSGSVRIGEEAAAQLPIESNVRNKAAALNAVLRRRMKG
jgi:hypothetical protein